MAPQSNAGRRTRTREEPYMPSYLARGQKCVVCADLATGLHYRAITCEGCKGFFRRVYQRDPHFECKGQPKGQCPISKSTRNACQKCRQDKCLRAGMDPQLVLDEVQRKMKRGLIERNRSRRQVQKRLSRIRRAILPARGLGQEEENRIRKLAIECGKTFVGLFEGTTTNSDGGERNKGGQYWALLWRLRVLKFAQAVLAPMELEAEESRNLDWRSLLVFVAAIRINPFGDENLGNEGGMGGKNGLGGNEIQVGKDDSPLQMDLAKMARKLAENELTNVQIGIMAAYLVFRGIQNAKITPFLRELLTALRLATVENLAKGETVEERIIPNWALLGLRLAELEELAKKHGAELEEGKLAEKLGENIQ